MPSRRNAIKPKKEATMNQPTPDRRASIRQQAIPNRARVEWLGGGELHESEARLVDIGRGGALLVTDGPLPLAHRVWIRIDEPAPTDAVAAIVVRREASNRFGLSFPEPCPYDLHLAATLGINPFVRLVA
jgi:hypothetical protein